MVGGPPMTQKPPITETIRKMATLAKIRLRDDELATYAAKMQAILTYVDQLGKLDTKDVEPMSHAIAHDPDPFASLRSDEAKNSPAAPAILSLAPERDGNYITVPKVVDLEKACLPVGKSGL